MFTHFGLWELLPANRIMRRKSSRETFSFKFSELLLWKQIYTEGSHSSSKDTESTLVPFYVHVLDVSILWFFWEVLVEKYPQNDRNYLPVQYIFLHGHPDCWGRVRPLGKKSFKIDNDNLNCFRKWKFWPSQTQVLYIHMISNILWYHALTDWDTGYLQKSFFSSGHSEVIQKVKVLTESSI